MPRILILDGNSLANRAFYALPVLTTSDGRPTNVLHGFMTMLFKLQQEQNPDYWVVAFDKTKATVRIDQYAEYKAHRKETPEQLRPQFDFLKEVLAEFSVPMLELAGYEADDLIATITKKAETMGFEVQIYTGDRDAFQLISPQSKIFLTKKGISEVERYDEQALWDKYQLRPAQIPDLKGLMGDSSDNIPGVPGVGEKTALKLLWEYGSVEEVLAHAGEVSGKKLQSSLQEYAEQALLSKKLATMLIDAPTDFSLEDFRYRIPDEDKALSVLYKYGLRNVARVWQDRRQKQQDLFQQLVQDKQQDRVPDEALGKLQGDLGGIKPWPKRVLDRAEWLAKIVEWQEGKQELTLAYRLEKTAPHTTRWLTWAVGVNGESFSFTRDELPMDAQTAWNALLADKDVPKVLADSKALMAALVGEGLELKGVAMDLALAAYLLNSSRTRFEPLDLVREYEPAFGQFEGIEAEAAALAQVAPHFAEGLEKLGLAELLHEIEEPLSAVLARMEQHGVAVDVEQIKEFGRELTTALQQLEQEIVGLAGERFNLNSPQQLGHILFEKLGLPPVKKTKTGYSTDAETLEELREAHPMIEKILDYRQLSKLMSTYINGLLAQEHNGRIHTTFQQTVTATGRLSSTEPNLQNIPIRIEYGRRLRKVFEPTKKDWLLLAADYSQIELRILAHYSEDPLLCESFALGQDVHTRTASEVFGIPMDEVTADMRRKAKAVNFGLVYGLRDYGLARDLGISRKEAKYYIDQYFARYYGVKKYLEEVVKKAKEEGDVRTLLNRLRRIPELHGANRMQRQFGERIAMNTPVQGTAADIMKLAMLRVAEQLDGYQATLLLQVHDELVLEVAPEDLDRVAELLKAEMEGAFKLSVPLVAECKTGPNWYEMRPYGR